MKTHLIRLIALLVLVSSLPALRAEIFYPWKEVAIGAFDAPQWFGLVFAVSKNTVFALRLKVRKDGETAEGYDLFYLVSEVGPHSPDGAYSRIRADLSLPFKRENETPILIKPSAKSDTLTLEWSRQDEKTVIGRIRAPEGVNLQIEQYFPWNLSGSYELLSDGQVQGTAGRNSYYLFWTNRNGESIPAAGRNGLLLSYSMTEDQNLYFVAGVGDDPRILSNQIYRYKNAKTIDSFLQEEEERYASKRLKTDGLYEGVAESITNNLFWMILYQPDNHLLYTPAGRRWIFPRNDGTLDHWTIFEWDSFLNALEVSVESSRHARDVIRAVLGTQYPNGNIPNWRGRYGGTPDRSQPPVGSYCVLKLFGKLGDLEFLRECYPELKKWHAFWKAPQPSGLPRRDGNGDGLLEWGSDTDLVAGSVPPREEKATGKQRAMWESGQDDLPSWEEASFNEATGTLTMNCVDLNSLYALDAYCLAQIANILDLSEDYEIYLGEYEEMKGLINRLLWNEREGFYFDRHWNGRFSGRKAASNFSADRQDS